MDFSIRLLAPTDTPLFKELLQVFADAFADPQTYQGAIPSDAYLNALIERDHFLALVAMDNGQVVGGLTAYVLAKFEQERQEIYIYDLAVAEAYRRQGIATGLINTLRTIARDRGAYLIFVQADAGDVPAIRLYESLGTGAEVYNFDIPVNESKDH